ncbi:MAG: hypothetical protein J5742_03835 [Alphaproteobacteria bacterium]|nr:hypothetical protein [Alphaproteobacteria bacterium]
MRKFIKKLLSLVLIALCVISFSVPNSVAESNFDSGDIGDYGAWTTEHNRDVLLDNIKQDVSSFESGYEREYINTGVPIEAKLGIIFIQALSYISNVLNISLVRFVIIFLIAAFAFWVMFEAYNMFKDNKPKVRETTLNMVKRGITLGIWLILLGIGLPRLFGMIMGPIIAFGSYISNIILDTVAQNGGYALSDTCDAIRVYAAKHMTNTSVIDTKFAADIICVPTRMSGFYYGAIKYGWTVIGSSIGVSTFSFLVGIILVCLFTYTAFKFAFVAFGVIADLFLVVILLPFTAISETVNKTKYEGIAGKIYNGFLGIFNPDSFSLSNQIKKFVDAAIYFVSLAIVVAIGGALLANGLEINSANHVITPLNGDRMTMLLIGALVAYIATHADDIAKLIGGAIDYTLGTELSKDATTLYKNAKKKIEEIIKAAKK